MTREEAIVLIIERVRNLRPDQLRGLAANMPVDPEESVREFGWVFSLSRKQIDSMIKHNISLPWELLQYAAYVEAQSTKGR
ncbi:MULTISPECIES: hypothetical protein [Arthrobacter]|uniref:Uncharacterized protein n=1 Tax=Arthrobacter terricola TaxID=2547396 RepID=A0A4R5KL62_9MICC|nr:MULTISPECIES: hypothetical protein [Arthrobacter]MBT8161432.1 hypothetical protein [Arthrobacter sp. GN70]TDF95605.1 hypothetical protein E1809_11300 [Arthrobacter terricola]